MLIITAKYSGLYHQQRILTKINIAVNIIYTISRNKNVYLSNEQIVITNLFITCV